MPAIAGLFLYNAVAFTVAKRRDVHKVVLIVCLNAEGGGRQCYNDLC